MKRILLFLSLLLFCSTISYTQQILLKPDRVFDDKKIQEGGVVLVEGEKIKNYGPENTVKASKNAHEKRKDLYAGMTLTSLVFLFN